VLRLGVERSSPPLCATCGWDGRRGGKPARPAACSTGPRRWSTVHCNGSLRRRLPRHARTSVMLAAVFGTSLQVFLDLGFRPSLVHDAVPIGLKSAGIGIVAEHLAIGPPGLGIGQRDAKLYALAEIFADLIFGGPVSQHIAIVSGPRRIRLPFQQFPIDAPDQRVGSASFICPIPIVGAFIIGTLGRSRRRPVGTRR
jgi:hypothetical protein